MKILMWVTETLAVVQAEEGESLSELALAGVHERRTLQAAGVTIPRIWPQPRRPKRPWDVPDEPPF